MTAQCVSGKNNYDGDITIEPDTGFGRVVLLLQKASGEQRSYLEGLAVRANDLALFILRDKATNTPNNLILGGDADSLWGQGQIAHFSPQVNHASPVDKDFDLVTVRLKRCR
jgi:glucose uptake protein GlcU